MRRHTLFSQSLDSIIKQQQPEKVLEIQPQPQNKAKQAPIRVKLPDYERFSKISPQRMRPGSLKDSLIEKQQSQIQVSPAFAWLLLLLNVVCTALVPCWLMSYVDKQVHTRNSWRFFVLSIITLPFVAFQKRKIAEVGGNIFDLINKDLLKNNFIASINYCIEILFVVEAIKLTSLTHSVTLVSLKYYIIALMKVYRNQKLHQFSKAGIMLVSVAVFCQISDNFNKQSYMTKGFIGVLGDLVALTGSIISAHIQQNYKVPSQPKFLNLFFRNLFISFNFICFGYYFGGSQLSFNEYYGVYALFTQQNFVNIFYVAIMLGLSLMISSVLLPDIFSFFIRDVANSFSPVLSSFFYRLLALQSTSSSYTYISFGFLIPGLILILSGQNSLKNGEIKIDFVVYRPQAKKIKQEELVKQMVELQDWNKLKKPSEGQILIKDVSKQNKQVVPLIRNMTM